jgi:tetratricopeptide (TPR) repeat protein
MVFSLLVLALVCQADPAALRRLFEENFARRQDAQSARDLGSFLEREGDAPGARAAFTRALRLDEANLGPAAPETLSDAAELAQLSPPADAAPLWRRAAQGADPALAARALAALGNLQAAAGDTPGAVRLLRQALAREEAATGRQSARVAVRLNALAPLLPAEEGIPLLERALAINRKWLGDDHPETATTLANLAGLYLDAGRAGDALAAARRALAALEDALGPDHPRIASAASMLAFCWRARGDRARAEQLYRRALAIDQKSYGPTHPDTLNDIRTLADFLRESGRPREAAELERRLR